MKKCYGIIMLSLVFLLGANELSFSQNIELEMLSSTFWSRSKDIEVAENYAYCPTGGGLLVLDISNPSEIEISDQLLIENGSSIEIIDSLAFYTSYYDGLSILDIRRHEDTQIWSNVETPAITIDIAVTSQYAYVLYRDGLVIVNFNDIENPEIVGECSTSTENDEIFIYGDYVYIATRVYGLTIIDVSDPSNPYIAAEYADNIRVYGIYIDGYYAYLSIGDDGIQVYNIENPLNPILQGGCDTPGTANGIYIQDGYAYVSDTNSGLVVIDISNPSNPTIVNSYEEYCYVRGQAIDSTFYLSTQNSINIYDIADPESLTLTGLYEMPLDIWDIAVEGNYAFIHDSQGLWGVDYTDPYHPQQISFLSNQEYAHCLTHSGNYICTMNYRDTINIIDISDPFNPYVAGTLFEEFLEPSLILYNNYLFVGSEQIYIYDIIEPDNPSLISTIDQSIYFINDYYISGNYMYLVGSSLYVLDISNMENPVFLGSLQENSNNYYDLIVKDGYAYLTPEYEGTLEIYDVSDPSNPSFVTDYGNYQELVNIEIIDSYAFVADFFHTNVPLEIIDISDPISPQVVNTYDTEDYICDFIIKDDILYVGCSRQLMALHYSLSDIQENNSLPENTTLSQNYPNPFNASTIIRYDLPSQSEVSIDIYDILGRHITTLEQGIKQAGSYQALWHAGDVSSGVYFYKLTAGDLSETKKMMLVK